MAFPMQRFHRNPLKLASLVVFSIFAVENHQGRDILTLVFTGFFISIGQKKFLASYEYIFVLLYPAIPHPLGSDKS